MSRVGSGTPSPLPEPVGAHAQAAGKRPPGHPARRLEPLQPLRESPQGSRTRMGRWIRRWRPTALLLPFFFPAEGFREVGEQRLHAAGDSPGQPNQEGQ